MMVLVLLLAGTTFLVDDACAGPGTWEFGVRAGWSVSDDEESFNQYDVFANYGLPWNWQWGGIVQVDTQLTTAFGILDGGGDTGVVGLLGFDFVFGTVSGKCPFEIRAGSGLTLISEDEYGDDDFGGPLQLTSHISLNYWILENLSAMARVQHMSNAGIYSSNAGLNLVMLGMLYRF